MCVQQPYVFVGAYKSTQIQYYHKQRPKEKKGERKGQNRMQYQGLNNVAQKESPR